MIGGTSPDSAPEAASRFAAEALGERGYALVSSSEATRVMAELAVTDAGQARCCIAEISRRTGADGVLLGHIDRLGGIGISTRFWRAVSNMVVVTASSGSGASWDERRYLSAGVDLNLLDSKGRTIWHSESAVWIPSTQLPKMRDSEEELYRDLFYAVRDSVRQVPFRPSISE